MSQEKWTVLKFISGNFLQTFQMLGLPFIIFLSPGFLEGAFLVLAWIYLLPPILVRSIYFIFGKPNGTYTVHDRGFWVWYFGAQMQSLYLRFAFLEEILRSFPLLYSNWLRLWGAQIGKNIYWAPCVRVIDRTHLKIDDLVLVGYGASFTGHHLNLVNGEMKLVVAAPHVEERSVLGGMSGMSPGSVVSKGELLPSTMGLAPFYLWKSGRRHATLPREENNIS